MMEICDFALKPMYFYLYDTACFIKQGLVWFDFETWIYVQVGNFFSCSADYGKYSKKRKKKSTKFIPKFKIISVKLSLSHVFNLQIIQNTFHDMNYAWLQKGKDQ